MINFLYGSYGCGKTTEILNMIAEDTKNGIHTFLIIPDQEAVQFERLTLKTLPTSSQLRLEILSFSRLYNRICREYGGLSYSYITKPIRSLMMWRSVRELLPLLESYSNISATDISATDSLISLINEFKASGLNSASLEIAAKKLPNDELGKRLRDLALIFSCYDNFISERYSDSADDLSRLYEILCNNDFFKDANVYIDSFSSYTGVQHKIIDQIFKTANNVTVTVPLNSPDYYDIGSDGICNSNKKLISSAKKHGGFEVKVVHDNKRTSSPALAYLSKNLWRMDTSDIPPKSDGSIICEICENRYAEAEAATAHIVELLRQGARCRDIVIIARDVEKYRGIIDNALAKSEIPYFLSENSDLCSSPAIKFILSALRIKKYNWQRKDVIAYIKTGLCDISLEEACLFEEYTATWNITGKLFSEETWTMNPDGFVSSLSERGKKILDIANSVKNKITQPLIKLFLLLDASQSVPDMCRAIYAFLSDANLEDKLSVLAENAAARGEIKEAKEISRIYEIILTSLSDIACALENEEADTEEFMQILKNVFEKTEIGSIPTSVDEITVGSAAMLRASNPKYAFVLGLCEGEFPATVKDTGLLSANDRASLASIGIELSGDSDIKNSDELMYARRAFSAPSEKLFLFTHEREIDTKACFPSLAFKRVEKLFPDLKVHKYKLSDLEYSVPAPKNAVGIFRALEESETKCSLGKALEESIQGFNLSSRTLSNTENCRVSTQAISNAFGNNMHFSATSFESYVKCPFGYFCANVLKLRSPADDHFNAANMGSFIHYILEVLIKAAIPKDINEPIISDEELIKKADEAIKDYLEQICPKERMNSKRLMHLYSRLRNLALLLARNTVHEFSASKFRPAFFELRANGRGNSPSPLVFTLSDGAEVEFSGIIDRVDLYKTNNSVYIRIVDYKTGAKTFSLSDIEHGINLQMLIYLFTLCRSSSPLFKASIGLEQDKHAVPAGIVYLSAAIPAIEAEGYYDEDNEAILKKAEGELVRSGLLLSEEEILLAMNESLDASFLAGIKKKNDTNTVSGDSLVSQEGFEELFLQIKDTVIKIAEELRQGNADARPLEYGKDDPCEYCEAKPICRKKH